MNKVIGGMRYDTEAAELLGRDSFSNSGDFNHWVEQLYRTKTGNYFLHGEGGPMSRYARATGQNECSGGEKIIPLTSDEAEDWTEEHLSGDEYEAIFGCIEKGDVIYKMDKYLRSLKEITEFCDLLLSRTDMMEFWGRASLCRKDIEKMLSEYMAIINKGKVNP